MATQKHRGRNSLVKRLAAQTGSEGMAIALLKKRGHMDDKGKLTAKGRERDDMTAAERGGKPSDYTYNPRTNTARKK